MREFFRAICDKCETVLDVFFTSENPYEGRDNMILLCMDCYMRLENDN